MREEKSGFLDFVRRVVNGDAGEVSRRLAANPALATAQAEEERRGRHFFFSAIAHYLYAGDTALHMAAAAFRRPMAMLLVAHGADCHVRNRLGAQPLHYAADANHWNPAGQAETIAYLLSIGADPDALDRNGVALLHRAVRTRLLPAVQALWTEAPTRRLRTSQDRVTSGSSLRARRRVTSPIPLRRQSHVAPRTPWCACPTGRVGKSPGTALLTK